MSGVILFDGVCNFCDGTINFILDRDRKQFYKFAANQSEAGREVLAKYGIKAETIDTLIVIEEGKVYTHSTGALRIARHLGKLWPVLSVFLIIPAPIRDVVYRFIARNRYKWFGVREACRVPTPEERARFL